MAVFLPVYVNKVCHFAVPETSSVQCFLLWALLPILNLAVVILSRLPGSSMFLSLFLSTSNGWYKGF